MGGMDFEIRSHDLTDLGHDIGDARHRLPKETKKAEDDVARKVAEKARSRATSLGSTAAHVAPSINSHDNDVTLGGGETWAMAAGAEFGRDMFAQFKPYTGGGEGAGYFLYPTIRDTEHDQVERFSEGIGDALGEAFR